MDKSGRTIRRMFDEISPTYDFLNHALSLNTDVRWRRQAAALAAPEGSEQVLDVCCGTGDLGFALHERGARVVGTDFAVRMLVHAGRKNPDGALGIAAADTLRLPFPDDTFDACTVAFGLRNTEDPKRALTEMARVVRPGGRVVILEFTQAPNPLLRFWIECVLPIIGDLISRTRAYTYLPRSVGKWYARRELDAEMGRCGMNEVGSTPLFPGIAAIHVGTVTAPPNRDNLP